MNDVYNIVRSLLLQNDDESRFALADIAEERGDGEMVKLLRDGHTSYIRHEYDMDASRVARFVHHCEEARRAFAEGVKYENGMEVFDSITEVEAAIRNDEEVLLSRICPRCHGSYVDYYEEGGQCPACDALDDDLIEYAEETDELK